MSIFSAGPKVVKATEKVTSIKPKQLKNSQLTREEADQLRTLLIKASKRDVVQGSFATEMSNTQGLLKLDNPTIKRYVKRRDLRGLYKGLHNAFHHQFAVDGTGIGVGGLVEPLTKEAWKHSGRNVRIVNMSPYQYVEKIMQGRNPDHSVTGVQIDEWVRNTANVNQERVDRVVAGMMKGEQFAAPHLDYIGGFSQEGLHRALAARSLGQTKIPVVITWRDVSKLPSRTSFATKELLLKHRRMAVEALNENLKNQKVKSWKEAAAQAKEAGLLDNLNVGDRVEQGGDILTVVGYKAPRGSRDFAVEFRRDRDPELKQRLLDEGYDEDFASHEIFFSELKDLEDVKPFGNLKEVVADEVTNLTEVRENKALQGFLSKMREDIAGGIAKTKELIAKAEAEGVYDDFPIGGKFHTPHTRAKGLPPWEVKLHDFVLNKPGSRVKMGKDGPYIWVEGGGQKMRWELKSIVDNGYFPLTGPEAPKRGGK